jgi:hypothetical protein
MKMVKIGLRLGSCFYNLMRERLQVNRVKRFVAYYKAKTRTSKSAATHCVAHARR